MKFTNEQLRLYGLFLQGSQEALKILSLELDLNNKKLHDALFKAYDIHDTKRD